MISFSTRGSEFQAIGETITARERLLRALRGQPADRVPVWMMRQAGRYLPEYNEVRRHYDFLSLCKTPEAAAEVSIQPLQAIGTDAVIIFNDILVPLEHAGAQVEFNDHGPLIHNPIRVRQAILKVLEASRELTSRMSRWRSTIREVRRRIGEEVPILGFIGAPWTLATYWVEGRMGQAVRDGRRAAFRAIHYCIEELLRADYDGRDRVFENPDQGRRRRGADLRHLGRGPFVKDEYARFSAPYIRRIIEAVQAARRARDRLPQRLRAIPRSARRRWGADVPQYRLAAWRLKNASRPGHPAGWHFATR